MRISVKKYGGLFHFPWCPPSSSLFPQFVFPDGMHLLSEEGPPALFHFVLTNSCGLKMHGAVLHVTEEIDPHHLGAKVSQALASSAASANRGRGGGGEEKFTGKNSPRDRGRTRLRPAQLPAWLRDTVRRVGGTVAESRVIIYCNIRYCGSLCVMIHYAQIKKNVRV